MSPRKARKAKGSQRKSRSMHAVLSAMFSGSGRDWQWVAKGQGFPF